jgi:hypothetical protein
MSKKIEIKKMLKEFNARDEDELNERLAKEARTIPCIICGKEIPIEQIHFIDGDPYCSEHENR